MKQITRYSGVILSCNLCRKIGSNAFEKRRDRIRFCLQRQGGGSRKNRLARIGLKT